jgi:hypothetical protein
MSLLYYFPGARFACAHEHLAMLLISAQHWLACCTRKGGTLFLLSNCHADFKLLAFEFGKNDTASHLQCK